METFGFDLSSIDLVQWWSQVVAYTAPRWLPSLLVLLIAGVVYAVAHAILGRAQRNWVTCTATKLDDLAVRLLRQFLLLSSGAWAIWRLLDIWGLPTLAQWVHAIWIGVLFFPLSRFVGDLLTAIESEVVSRTETSLDKTALPMINKAVRFVIITLGVVLALSELGINVTPLLAGAGVMGLALSLAAKDTLSNLIAGVLLIVDRPFQVGDRIELWTAPNETGSWGDVIEIGLRATKIRNPDNLVIVVPNNQIMQRDITNYTMSGEDIRLRIPFSVAYDSDIDRAKELLVGIANAVDGVKGDPEPIVIARGFGPSEVKLELRVWILDARARRSIADEISERALRAFAEAGVEIPYPRRELYIRSGDGSNAGIASNPCVASKPGGGSDSGGA
ncbi:mechanosensitive ion channel family protein [Candidatus Palauibacter sp.]|uniref:mechanosensitive ion channel family protein n=1 Tax=Candidatus Palauibacter sp. TaxID=3101350 RepID=UPI003CC64D56